MSFKPIKHEELVYYIDEKIENIGGVSHIFTTRFGGFSSGPLFSMNMSPSRENPDTVKKNYKLVCDCENIPSERCVLSHQTHTSNIKIVTEEDAGKGLYRESDIQDIDGLITNVKNLPIVIFYADCVPILLYDPAKNVIAAVHAGWRGTVSDIAGKAVEIMKNSFGSDPSNIVASIGPSIGPCCFETGEDAKKEFVKSGLEKYIIGNNIDLQGSNKEKLILRGVKAENITISGFCTKCKCNEFFSHRGCGSDTGRMALIACLR